jgi:hypothetical protein
LLRNIRDSYDRGTPVDKIELVLFMRKYAAAIFFLEHEKIDRMDDFNVVYAELMTNKAATEYAKK